MVTKGKIKSGIYEIVGISSEVFNLNIPNHPRLIFFKIFVTGLEVRDQETKSPMSKNIYTVASFYKFAPFPEYMQWRQPLCEKGEAHQVRGSVLLAPEGINGTIAGPQAGVTAVLEYIRSDDRFAQMPHKTSYSDIQPFGRMRVRPKDEIVKIGIDSIDPTDQVGEYISPEDWNQLIRDPDVTVIDTRNEFEVQIGSFKGAINPHTEAFNHFPRFAARNLDPDVHQKIAMFCTGGIRCEKATAFLLQQGFKNVYHLEGGILNYLEKISPEQSLWQGNCFVFDDRVTVNHNLEPEYVELCYACQTPISDALRHSPHYRQFIHCPNCFDTLTPEFIARAERKLNNRPVLNKYNHSK